jgi:predicted nucleotidyltransferase
MFSIEIYIIFVTIVTLFIRWPNMVFHKPILDILNSKTKQKVLLFLLKHEALMSEREIAAVSGVSHMSINRIMHELAQMNLVHILRAGRSHLWRVNRSSYVFQALSGIFQFSAGSQAPLEDLKNAILSNLPLSLIEKIILFGSIALGTEQFNSDIDLFVQVKYEDDKQQVERAAEKLASLCLERYGNILAPYVLSKEELDEKVRLPLIDSIKKGIILYPPPSAHES